MAHLFRELSLGHSKRGKQHRHPTHNTHKTDHHGRRSPVPIGPALGPAHRFGAPAHRLRDLRRRVAAHPPGKP
ncbi:hypothetical protein M0R45_012101 [Rubus argutus]|uniref:Uncharacterized protein n=1 Tax=Rubus argutus TaxID=59490 RepID=A0AAW1YES2_RUBAR